METEIITDFNNTEEHKQDFINDFSYFHNKALGREVSHGSSDQIRPRGEFGSGAPKNTINCKPTSIARRAKEEKQPKPNNKCNFPTVKCSNIKSRTRLAEIHFRLRYNFVHAILKQDKRMAPYLCKFGYEINDIASWLMGCFSNFRVDKSFLQDVYIALDNISNVFAFDRTFLSTEFFKVDVCTEYFPSEVLNPSTNKRGLLLGDFTEYFKFVVKLSKDKNFMANSNSGVEFPNTFFAQFDLERFQDLEKDKYGSIYDYKAFLVLLFIYHADRSCASSFDMTKFQKEIDDFTNSITATRLVIKRRVRLSKISFFSLFKAFSQISNPNFTVSEDIINKQIQIRSKNIELTIVEESKNAICLALMIASHNEIKNAFGTVNMDNILNCAILDSIFNDVMESIFLDLNKNLLLPTDEIPSCEAKMALLSDPLVSKSDGLTDYISAITLHENPSKITNKHRYRDICRKALPKNPKRQDKTGNRVKLIKSKYSKILQKKIRIDYEKMIRKILGV